MKALSPAPPGCGPPPLQAAKDPPLHPSHLRAPPLNPPTHPHRLSQHNPTPTPTPRCPPPQRAWNLDLHAFDFLDVRLRGDGRTYIASLRVNTMMASTQDAWQAPLRTM